MSRSGLVLVATPRTDCIRSQGQGYKSRRAADIAAWSRCGDEQASASDIGAAGHARALRRWRRPDNFTMGRRDRRAFEPACSPRHQAAAPDPRPWWSRCRQPPPPLRRSSCATRWAWWATLPKLIRGAAPLAFPRPGAWTGWTPSLPPPVSKGQFSRILMAQPQVPVNRC